MRIAWAAGPIRERIVAQRENLPARVAPPWRPVRLALTALILSLLSAAFLVVMPEDALARPVAQTGSVSVTKLAVTGATDGTVFNGDTMGYVILLTNNSNVTINSISILDVLPIGVLSDVQCAENDDLPQPCELINEIRTIPEPLGGTLTVTTTRQISWTVSQLAPGDGIQVSFTARVIGQTDGAEFSNIAYVSYREGTLFRTAVSNEEKTVVRVRIEQGGATNLSESPTWFSSDVGGTLSMDWADFDEDGDLDLALGSTIGTTVYRNEGTQLTQFWTSPRRAFGVRWADVDNDGNPELIAVGEIEGEAQQNIATQPGENFIYRYDPTAAASSRRFMESSVFTSTVQMVRIAPADYNGDGYVDIIASTNAINPECPVEMYLNDGTGTFGETRSCISRAATAALSAVDYDNDGDIDLVLGLFPNRVRVLVNDGSATTPFSVERFVALEESVNFLPYDFSWGDYNGDGFLDLAAAYPLLREVRVYRNVLTQGQRRFTRGPTLRTNVFLTPYSVDWGDFVGTGRIALAVADQPPKIYEYLPAQGIFREFFRLDPGIVSGQVWSLRAIDQNGDGDVDLAISDRDGPSLVISNFRPPISSELSPIEGVSPFVSQSPASSVAWADADGDGAYDLIFGAGPPLSGPAALNTKLYFNADGELLPETVRSYSGFGPHATGFADVDADGDMDVLIGTTSDLRLHLAGDTSSVPYWAYPQSGSLVGEKTLGFADTDGDVDLDLLVGTAVPGSTGQLLFFANNGAGQFGQTPVWSATMGEVRSIDWADYDGDDFPDFAVGLVGQNRIYKNNRDNTFTLAWTASISDTTYSVAWADYDGDGDPDLFVGNNGQRNYLYENNGDSFADVWNHTELSSTVSVDWGDLDNDGDPDLAVGNHGERVQIFVNLGSTPGAAQFSWLWSSAQNYNTTGVAWGDLDGDGDLDLAMSQDGPQLNGIFQNNYTVPSHLASRPYLSTMPLVNQPAYVYLGRPGLTHNAYRHSSAEILSGPDSPVVFVEYTLFDPDGARVDGLDALGDPIAYTRFQYSVDGGGTWNTALPHSIITTPVTTTTGSGQLAIFAWNAVANQAISDDTRFRVTVIEGIPAGPVQRASSSAISPPFRVRAVTCIWPENPQIQPSPTIANSGTTGGFSVPTNTPVVFTGKVSAGTGALYYEWDFGDGVVLEGQVVQRTLTNGLYNVRLSVTGEECPETRERVATALIRVGSGAPDLFLPNVATTGPVTETASTSAEVAAEVASAAAESTVLLPQVRGFAGTVQADTGTIWLRWQPVPAESGAEGYRLYRAMRSDEEPEFVEIASLTDGTTAYVDHEPLCDSIYMVTAFNEAGESPMSTASYYAPACR